MSDRASAPATLWGRGDRLVLAATVGMAFLLLGTGYWGVSGTRVFDDQVSAARLAAGGVLVAQAGFVLAVIRGRRALGRRLVATLGAGEPDDVAAHRPAVTHNPGGLVAKADMTRYHRETCAFTAGKAVVAAPVAEHERAGRRPCGVCRP